MASSKNFFTKVKKHPDQFYIIHYSSESLFDPEIGSHSPRITSIVVRHYATDQTVSFSTHTTAEYLSIAPNDLDQRYDEIEKELLVQFYHFVRDRREKYWVHWNMRNSTFGFEHIEHRYRVLMGEDPPSIPVEVRINLNDELEIRYGSDYAAHPRQASLMILNGGLVQGFMKGSDESNAFKQKDFIRMNTSTIAKVGFFHFVISAAIRGKLKTSSNGFLYRIDKLLESRTAKLISIVSAALGLLGTIIGLS